MYIIYSMKESMENERAIAVKNGIQKCKESPEGVEKGMNNGTRQQESFIGGVSEKGAEKKCGFESELRSR